MITYPAMSSYNRRESRWSSFSLAKESHLYKNKKMCIYFAWALVSWFLFFFFPSLLNVQSPLYNTLKIQEGYDQWAWFQRHRTTTELDLTEFKWPQPTFISTNFVLKSTGLESFITNLAVKVGETTTAVKISTIAILQRSAADPMKESDLVLI